MAEPPPLRGLPRRPPLLPDESLPSFVARLIDANFYDTPRLLYAVCLTGVTGGITAILTPTEPVVLERLGTLSGVPPAELLAASVHRFAPVVIPPESTPARITLPGAPDAPLLPVSMTTRQTLLPHIGQFCPACLTEQLYHRLIWMAPAATVCVDHKCLLLRACPACHAGVTPAAIARATCERCATDLRTAQPLDLAGDDEGLAVQRLVQTWLLTGQHPADFALPLAPVPVLYRVWDVLRGMLVPADLPAAARYRFPWPPDLAADEPTRKHYSNAYHRNSYCVGAIAGRALRNWPHGFHDLLDQYRQRQRASLGGQLSTDFAVLYTFWLARTWQHPAYEAVQEAFDEYLITRYPPAVAVLQSDRYQRRPGLAARLPYMSITEAAHELGINNSTLQRLLDTGYLHPYGQQPVPPLAPPPSPLAAELQAAGVLPPAVLPNREAPPRLPAFLDRRAVAELRARWHTAISRNDAAGLLGVSADLVSDLVTVGLLLALRGPEVDGATVSRFEPAAVAACLEIVIGPVRNLERRVGLLLTLTRAAQRLTGVGIGVAGLLAALATRRLPAYWGPAWDRTCANILIMEADLDAYLDRIKEERHWIGREAVLDRFGVKSATLARWVRAGLLPVGTVIGHTWYFTTASLETFAATYINTAEAATILGVGALTVGRWTRIGRLQAASGPGVDGGGHYLFRRADLVQWRAEHLTPGEVQDLLRISKSQLQRLVTVGKLPALDELGAVQRWFAYETVRTYAADRITPTPASNMTVDPTDR